MQISSTHYASYGRIKIVLVIFTSKGIYINLVICITLECIEQKKAYLARKCY